MTTSPLHAVPDPALTVGAPDAASPVPARGRTGSDPIRADTFAELSAAVADEALSAYRDSWPELADTTYAPQPDPEQCSRLACHPLPDVRLTADVALPVGHLHRIVAADPGPPLDLVADLIAAGIARDVLDCIATTERHRADQLAAALDSNRTIGTAQGILMVLHGLTIEQAFARLKQASQAHNRKLRDIAADVVRTGVVPDPPRRTGYASA